MYLTPTTLVYTLFSTATPTSPLSCVNTMFYCLKSMQRLVVKATGKVLGKTALGGVQVPPLNTRAPWIKPLTIRIEKPNWLR